MCSNFPVRKHFILWKFWLHCSIRQKVRNTPKTSAVNLFGPKTFSFLCFSFPGEGAQCQPELLRQVRDGDHTSYQTGWVSVMDVCLKKISEVGSYSFRFRSNEQNLVTSSGEVASCIGLKIPPSTLPLGNYRVALKNAEGSLQSQGLSILGYCSVITQWINRHTGWHGTHLLCRYKRLVVRWSEHFLMTIN